MRYAAALLVMAGAPAPSQTPAAAAAVRQAIVSSDIIGSHRADVSRYRPELLARSSAEDGAISELQRLRCDAAMTLTAMRFIDHTHRGRVDPRTLRFALGLPYRVHDLESLVRSLSAASNVGAFIDSVEPPFSRYKALTRALPAYRQLARDPTLWDIPVPKGAIRPRQTWAGVPRVRRLLDATAVADDHGHESFHDDIYGHDVSRARVIPTAAEGPFMRTAP